MHILAVNVLFPYQIKNGVYMAKQRLDFRDSKFFEFLRELNFTNFVNWKFSNNFLNLIPAKNDSIKLVFVLTEFLKYAIKNIRIRQLQSLKQPPTEFNPTNNRPYRAFPNHFLRN